MKKLKYLFVYSFVLLFIFLSPIVGNVYAAQYDLVAPTGQLNRGQDVQFTINIDTQGQSFTNASIGMTYKTDALQYVSTSPGDAFPTVQAENQEGGKLIFTATNTAGFSGTGTFAVVTFKIIATASGSTELCVLFAPSSTPAPTPAPTALPKSGSTEQTGMNAVIGVVFLLSAGTGLVLINRKKYIHPSSRQHRKTLH